MYKTFVATLITLFIVPSVPAQDPGTPPGGTDPRYYIELARVHQRYGFYEDAIAMFKKAIETQTDAKEKKRYSVSLAKAYLLAGRIDEAEKSFKQLVDNEKDREKKGEYCLLLAQAYEELNKWEKARDAYEFVLRNCIGDIQRRTAHTRLIKLLKEKGGLKDYIKKLEKRLKDDPDDLKTTACLAHALTSGENAYAKALPLYEKLFAADPADRTTANRLVQLYRHAGRNEDAAGVYIKLMDASPGASKRYYYERISGLYDEAGNHKEALKWDLRAIELEPDNAYAYLRAAEKCKALDDRKNAEKMFLKAIEKMSRDEEKQLVSLKLLDFYIDTENYETAKALSDKLLSAPLDERIAKEIRTRAVIISEKLGEKEDETDG